MHFGMFMLKLTTLNDGSMLTLPSRDFNKRAYLYIFQTLDTGAHSSNAKAN